MKKNIIALVLLTLSTVVLASPGDSLETAIRNNQVVILKYNGTKGEPSPGAVQYILEKDTYKYLAGACFSNKPCVIEIFN